METQDEEVRGKPSQLTLPPTSRRLHSVPRGSCASCRLRCMVFDVLQRNKISQWRRSELPLSRSDTDQGLDRAFAPRDTRLSCCVPFSPKGGRLRLLMRLRSELRGVSVIEQGTDQRSQRNIKCAPARAASSFTPGNVSHANPWQFLRHQFVSLL